MDTMKGSLQYLLDGFSAVSNYLIQHYREIGLSDQELILYLNLVSYASQNNVFPSMKVLSKNLHVTESDVFNLINNLERKHVLSIETRDVDGKVSSYYDLKHLYQLELKEKKEENHIIDDNLTNDSTNKLIKEFEVEFGRPLSPIEMEKVNGWIKIDHFRPELIEMALREAVLAQVYNFKYIDRILMNWKKRNIKTIRDYEHYKTNDDFL